MGEGEPQSEDFDDRLAKIRKRGRDKAREVNESESPARQDIVPKVWDPETTADIADANRKDEERRYDAALTKAEEARQAQLVATAETRETGAQAARAALAESTRSDENLRRRAREQIAKGRTQQAMDKIFGPAARIGLALPMMLSQPGGG